MSQYGMAATLKLTGLSEHTIRAWERRYGAVEPTRDMNGRRSYTAKDIQRLKKISLLSEAGHKISSIAKKRNSELDLMLKDSASLTAELNENKVYAKSVEAEKIIQTLWNCLNRFDIDSVNRTLNRAKFYFSPREVILNIISPLMERVGASVSDDGLCIAQEHALTECVKRTVALIEESAQASYHSNRFTAILATPEGDYHGLGIQMASALCKAHGVNTINLGPNLPARELALSIKLSNANLVIIGTTDSSLRDESATTEGFFALCKKTLPRSLNIWIGGSGTKHLSNLPSNWMALKSLQELDQQLDSFIGKIEHE